MPRLTLRRVVAVSVAAAATVLLVRLPALALPDPVNPVTGNATYFDALGSPYGGCGLPQANLDSQDFVALNVYNTPGDYNFYPRPLTGANVSKIGMWNNGLNCGRFVQVSIGDYCNGVNDGAPNQAFCRNGSFVADAYNGATLTMIVADSCGDSNAWCRDDPYHLDLAKGSLNKFVKNGAPVGDMYPNHWNNRHVAWKFIPAPNYSGDIKIGFLQGAQVWWPAISVSHLANGIHGVEYFANGTWQTANMNSDMGQSYIIGGTTSGANQFQIRVKDASDQLINGGRVYNFTLPASCSSQCSQAYTQVTYTTSGGTTSSPSPSVSPTPDTTAPTAPTGLAASGTTASGTNLSWNASSDNVGVTGYDVLRAPGASGGTFAQVGTSTSTTFAATGLSAGTTYRFQVRARDAAGNLSAVSNTVTVTTGTSTGGCSVVATTQTAWQGGYVIQPVRITNTTSSAITSWTVRFTLPAGQTVTNMWNATFTVSGQTVTARNNSSNPIPANGTYDFGFQGTRAGSDNTLPSGYTCTSP